LNPLNVDNRIRIESNYTTRSGERLADVAEIGSIRSGGKGGFNTSNYGNIIGTQITQTIS
jgi:hypothetical protein